MLIALVDMLRCPRTHDETWLVASIDRAERGDIVDGTLGCPICMTEYPIRDGIVWFDDDAPRPPSAAPNEAEATRLAAALDLTDPKMVAVLHGHWGAHAPLLPGLTPAPILLVNPPADIVTGDGVSIVVANRAPLARASVDAVAMAEASNEMAGSLVASLRAGRRMLAPASMSVPPNFTELARDNDVWVAQLDAQFVTSAPIMPLR